MLKLLDDDQFTKLIFKQTIWLLCILGRQWHTQQMRLDTIKDNIISIPSQERPKTE